VTAVSAFGSADEDLARMLILGEKQGEYTEEQKNRASRRIRNQKAQAHNR
jgi:hypothetical protein